MGKLAKDINHLWKWLAKALASVYGKGWRDISTIYGNGDE
jgi:hypothetical protein